MDSPSRTGRPALEPWSPHRRLLAFDPSCRAGPRRGRIGEPGARPRRHWQSGSGAPWKHGAGPLDLRVSLGVCLDRRPPLRPVRFASPGIVVGEGGEDDHP